MAKSLNLTSLWVSIQSCSSPFLQESTPLTFQPITPQTMLELTEKWTDDVFITIFVDNFQLFNPLINLVDY